jgi:threonylcarbamoyladenosine tRNA methylthiotransferase MtaB
MDLISELVPSRLHVFKYSDRKGTPAYGYADKVPSAVSKERVERLIREGERLQAEFCEKFIGKEVEILVEERKKREYAEGYTSEYLVARIDGVDVERGQIVRDKVTGVDKTIPCLLINTYESGK